jgi:hypothetical protein
MTEAKQELFELFKAQGLHQAVKAHMRAQLLQKLKGPKTLKLSDLKSKAAASLVVDFLQSKGLQYTLSVFMPEVGQQALGRVESAELLGVELTDGSILEGLVEDCHQRMVRPHMMESAAQTEDAAELATMEDKLKSIEFAYLQKSSDVPDAKTMEERMLRYRRECEARMRQELESEVTRIRELESSGVRLEEASKYRQELQKIRAETDHKYKEQLAMLRQREKESSDRLAFRERELDSREFVARQQAQKDAELLKARQAELHKSLQVELEGARIQRESWESKRRDVDSRLKELETLKVSLLDKAENDFQSYRRDYEGRHEEERRKISADRFDQEHLRRTLEAEAQHIRSFEAKANELTQQLTRVTEELTETKHNRAEMGKELADLKEHLKVMSETGRQHIEQIKLYELQLSTLRRECDAYRLVLDRKPGAVSVQQSTTDPFLRERKHIWRELDREEEEIKYATRDFIKPSTPSPVKDAYAEIRVPAKKSVTLNKGYEPKPVNYPGAIKETGLAKTKIRVSPTEGGREETAGARSRQQRAKNTSPQLTKKPEPGVAREEAKLTELTKTSKPSQAQVKEESPKLTRTQEELSMKPDSPKPVQQPKAEVPQAVEHADLVEGWDKYRQEAEQRVEETEESYHGDFGSDVITSSIESSEDYIL